MGDGPKGPSSGTRARNDVVLVVDDDRDLLLLLTHVLEEEGFIVVSSNTGRAALGLARAAKPDAIILDLTLPDLDGIQVARELKADERTRGIPVLLLTGRHVAESEIADLGLAGALAKPCLTEVVVERLREAIERSGKVHIA